MTIKKIVPIQLPEDTFEKGLIVKHVESGEEIWIARLSRENHTDYFKHLCSLVACAASDDGGMKDKEVYVYLVNFGDTHYGQMIWDKEAEPEL
jgi:hypothetical protein